MAEGICEQCERDASTDELRLCMICRSLFCRRCAVMAYGREFCSVSCSEFFFHGDGDDEETDN